MVLLVAWYFLPFKLLMLLAARRTSCLPFGLALDGHPAISSGQKSAAETPLKRVAPTGIWTCELQFSSPARYQLSYSSRTKECLLRPKSWALDTKFYFLQASIITGVFWPPPPKKQSAIELELGHFSQVYFIWGFGMLLGATSLAMERLLHMVMTTWTKRKKTMAKGIKKAWHQEQWITRCFFVFEL